MYVPIGENYASTERSGLEWTAADSPQVKDFPLE